MGLEQVLKNYTVDSNGCHIYQGEIDSGTGYGRAQINYMRFHVHRLSASHYLGLNLADKSQYACHKCSNRACINPDHLYIGDNQENQLDAVNNLCKNGHDLRTYGYIPTDGRRRCRLCKNIRDSIRYQTRRKAGL